MKLVIASKEVLVKGGTTTLHNNRNCININIYIHKYNPGFAILTDRRLKKCHLSELLVKDGQDHLTQKLCLTLLVQSQGKLHIQI